MFYQNCDHHLSEKDYFTKNKNTSSLSAEWEGDGGSAGWFPNMILCGLIRSQCWTRLSYKVLHIENHKRSFPAPTNLKNVSFFHVSQNHRKLSKPFIAPNYLPQYESDSETDYGGFIATVLSTLRLTLVPPGGTYTKVAVTSHSHNCTNRNEVFFCQWTTRERTSVRRKVNWSVLIGDIVYDWFACWVSLPVGSWAFLCGVYKFSRCLCGYFPSTFPTVQKHVCSSWL